MIIIGIFIPLTIRFTVFKKIITGINNIARISMIILSILGGILIIVQSKNINNSINLKNWNTTKAVILKCEIVGERSIRPQIEYIYMVDSISFRGESDLNVPMFGGKRKKYDVAHELIKEYNVGDTITISYNPNDPELSLYKRKISWDVFTKLSFGFILLILGIFFSSFPQKRLS